MSDENSKMFDRRTLDRYLERGDLKKTAFDAHLKGLPDCADQAQYVQMDLYEAEMSDADAEEKASQADGSDSEEA